MVCLEITVELLYILYSQIITLHDRVNYQQADGCQIDISSVHDSQGLERGKSRTKSVIIYNLSIRSYHSLHGFIWPAV
jgi:hypothetical protein